MTFSFPPERQGGAPIFNFRSEGRHFAKSNRCLIPASAFFEFTGKKYPKAKHRFGGGVARFGGGGGYYGRRYYGGRQFGYGVGALGLGYLGYAYSNCYVWTPYGYVNQCGYGYY